MYRKIEGTLSSWKRDKNRKPLLINGARQTGKTYTIREFGLREFDSMIFVDFEKEPKAKTIFDGSLDPRNLIPQLEMLTGVRHAEGRTLIFLDEIQSCPRAITSLKYFCDDPGDYHVIGAGSLLGVAIERNSFSFPVGKIRTERLYPLDFEEFMLASGKDMLLDECRKAFSSRLPVPSFMHEELLSAYRDYLVIGGMPKAVMAFIESGSYAAAGEEQSQILSDYRSDIAKYADDSEKLPAQRAFDTIPAQLAKDNRKFQYNMIRKGATSALFGKSLEWLSAAGLTLRCGRLTAPEIPLKAYEDISAFKLYLLDPGLLVAMAGLPKEIILNQIGERFIGGLTENYVASSLATNGIPLFYWESSGQAEIDFIIQRETDIVPVEVKASSHVRSRSLSVYRDRFDPKLSIRVSTRNFGLDDGMLSLPLYAVWLLNAESLRGI